MFLLLLHVTLGKLYTPTELTQDSVALNKMTLIKYFSNYVNMICIKSDIKFVESVWLVQHLLHFLSRPVEWVFLHSLNDSWHHQWSPVDGPSLSHEYK